MSADAAVFSHPSFGTTVTQAVPPPPISGGTLIVAKDGKTAALSDPDRDAVYIVDLPNRNVLFTVSLQPGDEPGRVVEDAGGRVHVVLRRGGALATIDLATGKILARRAVCAAPRGAAFDALGDRVHVACATGELVTFPSAGGAATRTVMLDRDLRDVVVDGGQLFVTRFRSAEVLAIAIDGTIASRVTPAAGEGMGGRIPKGMGAMTPSMAWRAIGIPGGGVAMLHQRGQIDPVATTPGGYGRGGCFGTSIVESTIVELHGTSAPLPTAALQSVVLAVDIAVDAQHGQYAVAAPGNARVAGMPQVIVLSSSELGDAGPPCAAGGAVMVRGEAIAVAFYGTQVLVQTREPATLELTGGGVTIPLSNVSRNDTGHAIFHANAGASVACASCHGEGGEDGRVWTFAAVGPRRTQSLRGTIRGTAPYHWDGDMLDIPTLVHQVFGQRMSGGDLAPDQVAALQGWVESIPSPPAAPAQDTSAVDRGRVLFNDPSVGCVSCHSGDKYTNNATVSVGTGGSFQVPSLVGVGWRSPFLHAGCAATLRDRFSAACATGDQHGHTSQLAASQVDDLVAFLASL